MIILYILFALIIALSETNISCLSTMESRNISQQKEGEIDQEVLSNVISNMIDKKLIDADIGKVIEILIKGTLSNALVEVATCANEAFETYNTTSEIKEDINQKDNLSKFSILIEKFASEFARLDDNDKQLLSTVFRAICDPMYVRISIACFIFSGDKTSFESHMFKNIDNVECSNAYLVFSDKTSFKSHIFKNIDNVEYS